MNMLKHCLRGLYKDCGVYSVGAGYFYLKAGAQPEKQSLSMGQEEAQAEPTAENADAMADALLAKFALLSEEDQRAFLRLIDYATREKERPADVQNAGEQAAAAQDGEIADWLDEQARMQVEKEQ